MSNCGCCGERGHSVTKCASEVIPHFVKLITEILTQEEAIEFIHGGLNTWQLTAVINYLDGKHPRHSKMRKHVKITTLANKLNYIKTAENSVRVTLSSGYHEFAVNLYNRLCEEFEPITSTTELGIFRSIIRKAVESMIRSYTEYDLVRLVNQHFVWQCLPSGLHCLCQMISVRYINRAFTFLQQEARMAAYAKRHLKNLEIRVNSDKTATFQDTKECQICVDPENKEFARLNCTHILCKKCVTDIAERREKSFLLCPYCREEIKEIVVINDHKNALQLQLNTV